MVIHLLHEEINVYSISKDYTFTYHYLPSSILIQEDVSLTISLTVSLSVNINSVPIVYTSRTYTSQYQNPCLAAETNSSGFTAVSLLEFE